MVFDTETTGIVKGWTYGAPLDNQPYITQLSYVLFNEQTKEIVKAFNQYIKLPDHVIVPEIVTEITGITRETCDKYGVSLKDCLEEFYADFHKCHKIIAHNITFDEKMIYLSYRRHWNELADKCPTAFMMFNPNYLRLIKSEKICTMLTTVDFCKIFRSTGDCYKWPKLGELHEKLFGYVPEHLHNSLVDVMVCLRCYLKLNNYSLTSRIFEKMINSACTRK